MVATLGTLELKSRQLDLGADYHVQIQPTPLRDSRLLHISPDAASLLGFDADTLDRREWLDVMSGAKPLQHAPALATVYAGHQFGSYVPQLGDGRAALIGEVIGVDGRCWELQLKGCGRTPFSRFGDGRAVLRSSIREYLCSEAMHALGVPTTRALCLVGSSEPVRREMMETAAMVCRMAPSHLRFGHFEYFYYQGRFDRLAPLADALIANHFPQWVERPNRHALWLSEVVERSARLIAQWQSLGFCHGVMNTDNMSALGLTLDYGPFGFMDAFVSGHICNHSDEQGRYAYDQQPNVAHWNCAKLLQATLPLLDADADAAVEIAQGILGRFPPAYTGAMITHWRGKLGLLDAHAGDRELINRFLNLIDNGNGDFTLSFRLLADIDSRASDVDCALRQQLANAAAFDAWLPDYRARLRQEGGDDDERRARMNRINPRVVLRNHLAQKVIEDCERGGNSELERLYAVLRRPWDEHPDHPELCAPPPPQLRDLCVSCSS